MLAKQVLAAIRETDDETFDEMLQFDFVALGGGVAAGYWVKVCSMMQRSLQYDTSDVGIQEHGHLCLAGYCEYQNYFILCFQSKRTEYPF